MANHDAGSGPKRSVSVSLRGGTIDAVRERTGRRGVSAYVENAVRRQIERDARDALDGAAATAPPAGPDPADPSA